MALTQVEFHTGVAAPGHFACRLLRKAMRQGVRVAVTAPSEALQALDKALWTFEEREFVPHLRVDAAAADSDLARRTPIWLVDGPLPPGCPTVLVNLGAGPPDDPARLSRLIEIVSTEPDDVAAARARWRHYAGLGLKVVHHQAPEAS